MRIIAGSARGRSLKTRKGMETRPTADRVKESMFNILAPQIAGARMLDVFAGSGGVGIEALSRGAQSCVFIEQNAECAAIIKHNLSLTGVANRGEVLNRDALLALSILKKRDDSFNLIFLDPPYHSRELSSVLEVIALNGLLEEGMVIVEHHSRDHAWFDHRIWEIIREKKYGDTTLSFLHLAAASKVENLSSEEEK